MKRLTWIIGGVSLFAWGVSGAAAGCGGDDAMTPSVDPDGGSASTSSGGSSGTTSSSGASSGTTSSSGSTSSNGGTGGDGGDGGDGGAGQSNPGKVTCGATECTVPAQFCCRGSGDAGCVDASAFCIGADIECDEKADCPGAEICCRGGNSGSQRCNATAAECTDPGEAIACKSNSDCPDAGTCTEWSCANNVKVRTCTMPPGCQ